VSPTLLEELCAIPRSERFLNELEFVEKAQARLLCSHTELITTEVTAWLAHSEINAFVSKEKAAEVFCWLRRERNEAKNHLDSRKERFAGLEVWTRDEVWTAVPDRTKRARLIATWRRDPRAVIESWGEVFLKTHATQVGLTQTGDRFPRASDVPTVWNYFAYLAARLVLLHRDGRSIDPNDYADCMHYAGSAYVDEMVTGDADFVAITNLCPTPRPKVIRFDDWAANLLR
jgi:hypothetical protein